MGNWEATGKSRDRGKDSSPSRAAGSTDFPSFLSPVSHKWPDSREPSEATPSSSAEQGFGAAFLFHWESVQRWGARRTQLPPGHGSQASSQPWHSQCSTSPYSTTTAFGRARSQGHIADLEPATPATGESAALGRSCLAPGLSTGFILNLQDPATSIPCVCSP